MQTDQETNSGNKIIHGDNLEALKALLPEYEGRIKCIYIDLPYNTGNEGWVYIDNVNDPKIKKWLGQVVGKESDDLTRHDKWLCMMISNFENSNTMNKILIILVAILLTSSCQQPNKEKAEENQLETEKRYQAKAPSTQTFGKEAFKESDNTTIRWLGMSGFLINSRGTTIMIDPLLGGFDMPIMIEFPIKASEVPSLDAVLVTHSDNDHYSRPTCAALKSLTKEFHSTIYVDSLMKNQGLPSFGHNIGASFKIGEVKVSLTPADHAWQNAFPEMNEGRYWKQEDCAGFWIDTPDGSIWATGDSRLMPEHLKMPIPDAILFDFSDSEWHFTLKGAVKLANAYPDTPLLLHHWGSVDAPDFPPFNGEPEELMKLVDNPERIVLLAPGESFTLKKLNK